MLDIEVLSRTECDRHLRAEAVGRAGVCTPDGPHIVPVNYAMTGEAILVRTVSTSVLGTHAPGKVVSLEIDGINPTLHAGWSVMVRGRAEAAAPAQDVGALRSWIPRDGDLVLRLPLAGCEITGRLLPAGLLQRTAAP